MSVNSIADGYAVTQDPADILHRQLDHNGVLRLTLNDAGKRNALSEAMLSRLAATFAEAASDPAVRGPK